MSEAKELERKDWEEAVSFEIQDSDIERQQKLLGYYQPQKLREYIQTATEDNIRNFAHGVGNDNPLHCDPEYASGTRWGSVVAPSMMAGVINSPMKGDPVPDHIRALRKSLWKGIHVFVSGSKWDFYGPIFPGDTLYSYTGDESCEVKQSEFSGRSIINVRRYVKVNQRSEVVAVYRMLRILTERKKAVQKGKYSKIESAHYDQDQIAAIDEIYANEVVRGADARYFEDVDAGDELNKMVKGPLTVTDVMCFHAGGYGFVPYAPRANRLAYQNRQRIPAFYITNEQGVPDVAQRLHWDPSWAKAIGNPMAYDYGVMRENHVFHFLTDWAGDDGLVVHVHDQIRKFNYMGDVQHITGKVTGKREEGGQGMIDVEVRLVNQRSEETVNATATIVLPKRDRIAMYPEVPAELAEEAARMMAKHWELSKT